MTVFGLSEDDVAILKRLAATVDDIEKLIAKERGDDQAGVPQAPDMYMAYVETTAIPAATGTAPSLTPGSLSLTLYRRNRTSGQMEALTHPNSNDRTETIYNASTDATGTGTFLPVERDKFGDWWVVFGDSMSLKKPLVRFTLDNALTTSEASESATITDQYGPGADNATSITVHNLEIVPATGTATEYMFSGDSGDAGYALWDSGTNYRIIQLQC